MQLPPRRRHRAIRSDARPCAMKILLCSYVFPPSVGGIETVSRILAEQFSRLGATVTVVTHTPGPDSGLGYKVIRRPSLKTLRALARDADVILQSNISLRTLLPLFFTRKPIVIVHHGRIARVDGSRGWRDYLKRALLFRCANIAVSRMIAEDLPVDSIIIANPFDPEEFAAPAESMRDKDIVFLGRLVSDKGCDLALRALALLRQDNLTPSLTVIGDGPEIAALKQLASELDLSPQVQFLGAIAEGRGKIVARHKIMVVPSAWEEPFGVVALEGIAAGCGVVASRSGGLPEAVGPCGVFFPKGDVAALASALKSLLANASEREQLIARRSEHLMQFQPDAVARLYLDMLSAALHK
jgi:glycogen(starch) synthase